MLCRRSRRGGHGDDIDYRKVHTLCRVADPYKWTWHQCHCQTSFGRRQGYSLLQQLLSDILPDAEA